MANDALDPGLDGSYPNWPRKPDGTNRMPWGRHIQRTREGKKVLIDVTPRHADGTPIMPPDLAEELGADDYRYP